MARVFKDLDDIVRDFIFSIDEDDFHKYSLSFKQKVRFHAMAGLRELQQATSGNIKSVLLTVDSTGHYIDFPSDYIDYRKIGILDGNNNVRTLGVNPNMTLVDGKVNHLRKTSNPELNETDGVYLNFVNDGYYSTLYGVATGLSQLGEYRVDKRNSRIEFTSELYSPNIVLEYYYDESLAETPKVDVHLEEALKDYIYFCLVERKSNVPMNEKERARLKWRNSQRVAKIRVNRSTIQEIVQANRENDSPTVKK